MKILRDTCKVLYDLGYKGMFGALRAYRDGLITRQEYSAIKHEVEKAMPNWHSCCVWDR